MVQPLGFEVLGAIILVCHLCHSIYGLKLSPHTWLAKLRQIILSLGLTPYEVDPIDFSSPDHIGCIILSIYVDDIHVT